MVAYLSGFQKLKKSLEKDLLIKFRKLGMQ